MTPADKIGQMFMGNFCGADSAEYVREKIMKYRFGALQLSLAFQKFIRKRDYRPCKVSRWRPAHETAAWLHEINRASREELGAPCFVAIDREYGGGMIRRCGVSEFPAGMGFGAAENLDLHYRAARIQMRETRAMGINMVYGPVLDLACNPDNPEVGIRAYSDSHELAGKMGAEYVKACREENVVCTAKHFPGRGRGRVDAHLEFETIDVPREEYEKTDLEPFRAAIRAGTPGIMLAHTHYTAFQSEKCPGSLSGEMINGLLRSRLGFHGIVIPDSLTMFAVSSGYEIPEAAVLTLAAGSDMFFVKEESLYEPCFKAVKEAVESGRLGEEEVDAKIRRILKAKEDASMLEPAAFDPARLSEILNDGISAKTAGEAAAESSVLVKKGRAFPGGLNGSENILVVMHRRLDVILHNDPSRRHDEFYRAVRKRHRNAVFLLVDIQPTETEIYEAEALMQNADFAIMALDGINRPVIDFFKRLRDMKKYPGGCRVPVSVVNFGAPYIFGGAVEGFDAAVQEFGYMKPTVETAAAVLFGEKEAGGKLPVSAGRGYPKGHGE